MLVSAPAIQARAESEPEPSVVDRAAAPAASAWAAPIAADIEAGRCDRALRAIDLLAAGSSDIAPGEHAADRALLRAYAERCRERRAAALAAAEEAARLDARWVGAPPRFGGARPDAALPDGRRSALGAFAAQRWDAAAVEGEVDAASIGEALAWIDEARPTRRAGAALEALAWRMDPDARRRVRRRMAWLEASAEHTVAPARAQALLRDPEAVALLATTPEWRDVLWAVAAEEATGGRPELASALVEPEESARVRRWSDALGRLDGRRAARSRDELAGLASGRGRIAAESSWALIVDARRDDRDAEALERVQQHLARFPFARRVPALEACVHLAGAAENTSLQRMCWERRRSAQVDAALAELTIEVVVDALHADGPDAAARVLDAARSAGVEGTVALTYWRARVDAAQGDEAAALAGYRAVFERAPLSWYGLWADARATGLGAPPKWRAWARTLRFAAQTPPTPEDDAYAAGLARLGLWESARRERSWRALRSGRAAHVALAADTARVLGDDDGAAWMLARHGDAETMPERALPYAHGATWRAVFPTPYAKAMRAASDETGVAASWLWAVARRESAFDARARSGAGALGLMQVLPATAREAARNAGWERTPTRRALLTPETSARAGATILDAFHARYGACWEPVLTAYAAGPARVAQWTPRASMDADIWLERMPYPTVRRYVRDVVTAQAVYAAWTGEAARDPRCTVEP